MKIYNAGLSIKMLKKFNERFPNKKINVLRSYGRRNRDDALFRTTYRNKCASLIEDSGTYSANNRKTGTGPTITFNGYLDYIIRNGESYDCYFNYDIDFSNHGFDTNIYYQKRMEDAGLNPVPVVHDIYGYEIDHYVKSGYKVVALGSSQITNLDILRYAMDKFKGTGIKIHLFGNTTFDFLTSFPIYSCDSTSWANTGRFGDIRYWNPKKQGLNKTKKFNLEEYSPPREYVTLLSEYKYREEFCEFLHKTLGVTEMDLLGPEGTYYKQLVNLYYYVQLEEIVNKIHRAKGFWTAE